MKRLIITALLCCIPVFALAQDGDNAVPEAGGKKHDEAFMAAYSAVDIPAILKMYADDAVYAEAGMDKPIVGKTAIEEQLKKGFAGVKAVKFEGWASDYKMRGEFVFCVGYATATMVMDDDSTMKMRADFTDIRKQNSEGEWQYVHDFVAFTPVEEEAGE